MPRPSPTLGVPALQRGSMRFAVFVDAGYLFAEGSVLLTGARQSREALSLDIPAMTAALVDAADDVCDAGLLRIYWYDAMRLGRLTSDQIALADSDDIKLRLGQINAAGEQKGVDALIITDLAELARNHAITDAMLVSGDEDLRMGVVLAQAFGVRVHLLGIETDRNNQGRALMQECDTTSLWDAATVGGFLRMQPQGQAGVPMTGVAGADLEAAIASLVGGLGDGDLAALQSAFAVSPTVPQDADGALLRIGRAHFGQDTLSPAEKATLRSTFLRLVQSAR